MCSFGVHLWIDQWLNHTLSVGNFYWVGVGLLQELTSDWIRHFVLTILMSLARVHLACGLWIKLTLSVTYFTELIWVRYVNWTVNKVDNLCQLYYWVVFVYVLYFSCDENRHYLLAMLLGWLDYIGIGSVIQADTMCWMFYWFDFVFIP